MNVISGFQMNRQKDFEKLKLLVNDCKSCPLSKTRKNPVFGEGANDAKILFIGEAPGRNEDLQGRPFVGRAGKILDELLESIDLKREDVYITNILKCRPPENRNPLKSEMDVCTKYLDKQIELIEPTIIAPLGNFATTYIFEKFNLSPEKIGKVHGQIFNINTISKKMFIVPIYHPAVATYNPNTKNVLLADFKKIKKVINEND